MYKILVTDYQWPSLDIERRILADLPGELIVAETGEEAELVSMAPQANAILTCWKQVTPAVIDAAEQCRIITRYGMNAPDFTSCVSALSGPAYSGPSDASPAA